MAPKANAEDLDGDGFDHTVDCDDQNIDVFPDAQEVCDDIDNDCDGLIDEALRITYWPDVDMDNFGDPSTPTPSCTPPDGYINNNQDCDDTNADIHPFAEELCDEIDNNCNYSIDEGCGVESNEPEDTADTNEPEDSGDSEDSASPDSAEPEDTAEPEDSASPDSAEPGDTSEPEYTSGPLKSKGGCAASPLLLFLLLFRRKK